MTNTDEILDEVKRLKPDPPRSKLDDYAEVIWELRRKRKRICAIAAFLVAHGVAVGKSTIARWLKAHPAPKTDVTSRQLSPVLLNPEGQERSDKFFDPSTNLNHEPKKYNLR